jgi:hypothetical protein
MSLALIPAQPTSLAQVDDQCSVIEQWAEGCDSVAELRDATNKLAAIDEYLTRTSTEGRSRVAAAMRRLEVRIGKLLPPPAPPGPRPASADRPRADDLGLHRQRQAEFRQMAEHEDVVEEEIARSTDEQPASRRRVQEAIRERTAPEKTPEQREAEADLQRRRLTSEGLAMFVRYGVEMLAHPDGRSHIMELFDNGESGVPFQVNAAALDQLIDNATALRKEWTDG